MMLVISSPSGAGKTTLARMILARDGAVRMSVSFTTRPRRACEREGVDYMFVDEADFAGKEAEGAFLETAHVFGHRYGTPRAAVERWLAEGIDVLFDVDWQGARQLRASMGEGVVVSVFVLPPSRAALEARLRGRRQDRESVVRGRMERAGAEISHWNEYDYVLVNHDIETCHAEIAAILQAERLRRIRREAALGAFAATLREKDDP